MRIAARMLQRTAAQEHTIPISPLYSETMWAPGILPVRQNSHPPISPAPGSRGGDVGKILPQNLTSYTVLVHVRDLSTLTPRSHFTAFAGSEGISAYTVQLYEYALLSPSGSRRTRETSSRSAHRQIDYKSQYKSGDSDCWRAECHRPYKHRCRPYKSLPASPYKSLPAGRGPM